jgi:hypothetical protein
VSPTLLSRLSSGPITVALELHHSLTNTTHPSPSPIVPGIPRRRSPTADARHLVVDRPSQAPSGQIGPTTVIPYPRPCLATTPSTQNWDPGGEPPWGLTGGRAPTGSPPHHPLTPSPPLLAGTWARAHDTVPALFPRWLAKWAACPRVRVRPRSAGPNFPLAQPEEETLFFFPFSISFSYFHIFMHILIFYEPKIV